MLLVLLLEKTRETLLKHLVLLQLPHRGLIHPERTARHQGRHVAPVTKTDAFAEDAGLVDFQVLPPYGDEGHALAQTSDQALMEQMLANVKGLAVQAPAPPPQGVAAKAKQQTDSVDRRLGENFPRRPRARLLRAVRG